MISRNKLVNRSVGLLPLIAAAMLTFVLAAGGCSSEEPDVAQAPAPPTPPPAPAEPEITTVADLMAQLGIDERIEMDERQAPRTDPARRAVLEFFDAFARADVDSLRPLLTLADQLELERLAESGALSQAAEDIDTIELQTGRSPYGQDCALAIYAIGGSYQLQLWYYTPESDNYVFEAVMTPPGMVDRLHGSNWIEAWHDILEEEVALADQADQTFDVTQQNLDGGGVTAGSGTSAPAPPAAPVGPGPGRFDPK